MNELIGPNHTSFVKNRQAADNAIIGQELIKYFKRMKGKKDNLVMKIDLKKAFDKFEWSYDKHILHYFMLPPKISSLIMSCISTSRVAVLINDTRTEFLEPSRGIRQGEPMSPDIFILCMKYLSKSINYSVQNKLWKLVKIACKCPELSHLFFADDLVLI